MTAQSAPTVALPPGACDCHAHVFGPAKRYPPPAGASYALPDAPSGAYGAMLDAVGMSRGVLVQPSAYGFDHAALLDTLAASPRRLRAVGLADARTTEATLHALVQAGVRALRFVDMRDGNGNTYAGAVPTDALWQLAPRMRALGLHAQIWAPLDRIAALAPALSRLDMPIVFDHMAGLTDRHTASMDAVRTVLAALRDGWGWVKLTLCRASADAPLYRSLRPLHDALIKANPAAMLWGSDWPFIRMDNRRPDVGALLDRFADWAGDAALCQQILRDNPARLFGFA